MTINKYIEIAHRKDTRWRRRASWAWSDATSANARMR